jgi:alginate O-acetyltransferase complex protein AlgI
MQFTSIVFLFLFLPIFCGLYFLTPGRYKNITLLLFSLFFYFSLAHTLVLVLLFSGLVNYTGGILISRGFRKTGLFTALLINILLLFFYKYAFALAETISSIAGLPMLKEEKGWISMAMVVPVGISFFTFRAISYLFLHRETDI